MKTVYTSIILLSVAFVFTSFTALEWFVYEGDHFSISFPKKPAKETKMIPTKLGEVPAETLVYNAETAGEKNRKYYFSVNPIPNLPDNGLSKANESLFFNAAISSSVRNHKAILVSETPISLSAYSGREVKMSMNEGAILISMRLYIVADKYYGLVVYTAKEQGENAEIGSFFNSFSLKPGK